MGDGEKLRTGMEAVAKHSGVFLMPPATAVETDGSSAPFELRAMAGRQLLIVLRVEKTIEQESLDVSLWGSEDGAAWGAAPLFRFPQVFYRGVTAAALNLTEQPQIKFLQTRWEVNRWGRGSPRPLFVMSVEVRELD